MVVVTRPTIDDWADANRFGAGLVELAVRAAIPALSDDDVDAARELIATARRQNTIRDHGHTRTIYAWDKWSHQWSFLREWSRSRWCYEWIARRPLQFYSH